MKKNYIRPIVEIVAAQHQTMMDNSNPYDWADARQNGFGGGGGAQVIENGRMQNNNRNMWDE